jgi:hypothetical protein
VHGDRRGAHRHDPADAHARRGMGRLGAVDPRLRHANRRREVEISLRHDRGRDDHGLRRRIDRRHIGHATVRRQPGRQCGGVHRLIPLVAAGDLRVPTAGPASCCSPSSGSSSSPASGCMRRWSGTMAAARSTWRRSAMPASPRRTRRSASPRHLEPGPVGEARSRHHPARHRRRDLGDAQDQRIADLLVATTSSA